MLSMISFDPLLHFVISPPHMYPFFLGLDRCVCDLCSQHGSHDDVIQTATQVHKVKHCTQMPPSSLCWTVIQPWKLYNWLLGQLTVALLQVKVSVLCGMKCPKG